MDKSQITLCFSMAEKPVKQLLNSYFVLFREETKLDTCEKMSISTKRIPSCYIQHGEMVHMVNQGQLMDKFLLHDSLLKIPPKVGEMKIAKDHESSKYLLFLDLVDNDYVWDETIFDPFRDIDEKKDQVKQVKMHIGNLMKMAQFVFACLKKTNKELEFILLDADPENVTLKIRDGKTNPKYNHAFRIGFKIVLCKDEEAEVAIEI